MEITVVVDDVHCPNCNHVFDVETEVDIEPESMDWNDLD